MIRVAIVGSTGYAGAELVRILAGHPGVELTMLTSRQYAGIPFTDVFPSMSGTINLTCEELSIERLCDRADVIFTALPHKLPMEIVPEIVKRNKKVVDLSADFRFKNVSTYEKHYQPHTSPDFIEKSVYGLPEIYFEEIKNADIVGNPGCYPTSVILPLYPLIKKGLLDVETIIADSKSGVSGAGRSVSLTVHFCEVNESFKAYKAASHRHNPEMNEILSEAAGESVNITFVPHLVPMTRGMLSTVYAQPSRSIDAADIENCLTEFYAGRPFIRIRQDNRLPDTLHVRGTNFCDIGFKYDPETNRIILISAIDNLGKGAAGQAVQNMNIMSGFRETDGLSDIPYPL